MHRFMIVAVATIVLRSPAWAQDRWVVETDVREPRRQEEPAPLPPFEPVYEDEGLVPSIRLLSMDAPSLGVAFSQLGSETFEFDSIHAAGRIVDISTNTVSLDKLKVDRLPGFTVSGELGFIRFRVARHAGEAADTPFLIHNETIPKLPAVATLRWDVDVLDLAADARLLRADIGERVSIELFGGLGFYRMGIESSSGPFALDRGVAWRQGEIDAILDSLTGVSAQASVRVSAELWDRFEVALELGEVFRFGDARGGQTRFDLSIAWRF
jgi:hypothetical protein